MKTNNKQQITNNKKEEIKKSLRDFKTVAQRRQYLEKITGLAFSALSHYPEGLEAANKRNCENMVGAVQLPLGIAGPLKLKGEYAKGEYFLPLATTEAALVASVARGCKAITLTGGAQVYSSNVGITRGSVFVTKGIKENGEFKKFLETNFIRLSEIASLTSSHLTLTKIETNSFGKQVFVRFYFDTQDAMGMNMVTAAVQKMADFVKKELRIRCVAIAGNFDVDKKPSFLNFLSGRGKKVWAEAILDKKTVKEVLKTTPENLHEVALRKCLLGSIASGSLGYNAHFANIIAALFIACGQDPAHVVEGSLGVTSTEIVKEGLYISVYLPDLVLGTVGGGTGLPAQNENLSLLSVSGGNSGKNAIKFSEIVAGAVLAGETSLLAALASGSLAKSHQKLAQKKST